MNDENRCPGTNNNGEQCGHPEGWGTDNDTGPCKHHGGKGGDVGDSGGAPESNTNASSHGLYAQTSAFYQDIATDEERALVDRMFEDYCERYRDKHGDLPEGHEIKLFNISTNIAKEYHGERWATQRPDDSDTGNALVDAKVRYTEQGDRYHQYEESPVIRPIKTLSTQSRQWLKSLGLLEEDPETQQANALADGLDLTLSAEEKDELDAAFDVEPDTRSR